MKMNATDVETAKKAAERNSHDTIKKIEHKLIFKKNYDSLPNDYAETGFENTVN